MNEELSIEDEFEALERLLITRPISALVSPIIINNIINNMETPEDILDDQVLVTLEKPKRKYVRKVPVVEVEEIPEEPKLSPEEQRIIKIKEIAEFTHPECWSFDVLTSDDRRRLNNNQAYYQLAIYFDQLTIKNSEDNKHDIKGLYILIYFDIKVKFSVNMRGFRSKITIAEILSNYLHSHNSGSPLSETNNGQTFCLGNSSSKISILAYELATNWNDNIFQEFLLILYTYASWESLEGGPHRRMSNITKKINISTARSLSIDPSYFSIIYSNFLESIKNNKSVFFNITKLGNIPFYKSNLNIDNIEELLKDEVYLRDNLPSNYWALKNSRGEYFDNSDNNPALIQRDHNNRKQSYYIIVGGERIHCDIEDKQDKGENLKRVLHPDISKNILKALDIDFNNYITKQ